MAIPTIEEVRTRLIAFKGRYPEICDRSGLDYSWLSKFARGDRGKRPSFELITMLDAQLTEMEAEAAPPNDANPPVRRTSVAQGASTEATEPVLTRSTTTVN
jgi:transcriptional regulator with XRE-family HTH domain